MRKQLTAGQISLFQENPVVPAKSVTERLRERDEFLKDLAFVYTATEGGKHGGRASSMIRFAMPYLDAMEFCSMPNTSGQYLGNRWAYFFTSFYNYIIVRDSAYKVIHLDLDLRGCKDDGRYDAVCAEHGLRKYSLAEIRDMLAPHGIRVKY